MLGEAREWLIAPMRDLEKQLNNYRLTTAEILYHLPDCQSLLQTYVWQDYDIAPGFPVLRKFLDFWTTNLEGKLHSVRVAHTALIRPAELRKVSAEIWAH